MSKSLKESSRTIFAAFALMSLIAEIYPPSARAFPGQRDNVDLGPTGNNFVYQKFAAYQAQHPDGACRAFGSGKRVIVTGYGLFAGVPYNISGAVVRSMADPGFWPESVDLNSQPGPGADSPTPTQLQDSDNGGLAYNRTLTINGTRYDVCFLTLDVIWDLAGAILIDEAARFQPDLIVMTGRGADVASFEEGAVNTAMQASGYGSDGNPLPEDTPVSTVLLDAYPADATLPMTWNPAQLAGASQNLVAALGYQAVGQTAAAPGNDYLCNNISFVMLNAAQNKSTALAGGTIVLDSPNFSKPPVVGFLHFPGVDFDHPDLSQYGSGIFGWAKVIATTIDLAAK